ncbi:MAG: hypothetical protein JRN52_11640 [Nitrososphaerota archaeon]|nr:hypothetical protein [Nitrososphaerota archaeon]
MRTTELIALDAIVIAIIVAGAYAYTSSVKTTQNTTLTVTTTVLTSVSTCTTLNSTTSTTTTTTVSSRIVNGSFTYSPVLPVVVKSVQAVLTTNQNGSTLVTFNVFFVNGGDFPIYIVGGCGSGLTSAVANSSIIQKITGGPFCACPLYILQLPPGQNHTSTNPGCWSGYAYELSKPGKATVELTQSWSASQNNGSTVIQANFTFA